jgi:hypothetical protein
MHQISKILFRHKTLHVSGIFCAHHQELSTVHTTIGMFHSGYVTASQQSQVGTALQFQPDFGSPVLQYVVLTEARIQFYPYP